MKATHRGHCQICNRRHKVSQGGYLANHGYHKTFHFHSGTCSGSGRAPYEKSCAALEPAIQRQSDRILGLQKLIDEALQMQDTMYILRREQFGKRFWRKVPIADLKPDEIRSFLLQKGCIGKHHNEPFVRIQRQEIAQIESFIQYMKDRVQAWKPAELIEIKEGE
jgi:hypothetical protein